MAAATARHNGKGFRTVRKPFFELPACGRGKLLSGAGAEGVRSPAAA